MRDAQTNVGNSSTLIDLAIQAGGFYSYPKTPTSLVISTDCGDFTFIALRERREGAISKTL